MIAKELQTDTQEIIEELDIDKSRFELVMSLISNEGGASSTFDPPVRYTITILGVTYEIE